MLFETVLPAVLLGSLFEDVKLALIIITFIFLVGWTSDKAGSKTLGIVLAAIIAYLTFYTHFEILIIVLLLFFGYPFFEQIVAGLES